MIHAALRYLGWPRAIRGGMAEWLRQGPAKPCTRVRFPLPPRGRLAQRESASLTRKRSLVQSQYRPPEFLQVRPLQLVALQSASLDRVRLWQSNWEPIDVVVSSWGPERQIDQPADPRGRCARAGVKVRCCAQGGARPACPVLAPALRNWRT